MGKYFLKTLIALKLIIIELIFFIKRQHTLMINYQVIIRNILFTNTLALIYN
ncbi:conserved hypothetical protein [Xenorhabdus nematophila F1]|uniref:Uncharacterized protein n=1 Tax=Xenorhabdus nematophila (strain ATCC 19061 / DSM 3370 / CCUG 14189 / LMG 1036 / NCIMB 9965 / AN6) TaxID=406817 RepID=D3V904_XENNA|nr:hypothetical protein XNC1_1131 [Xenorhabdus nematophila ATCC 19061]CCW30982.1 conserved hypothetical protein [Xenorhabdus nematophila F1]CEK22106.1 hypothetical protein XNC2_1110 [Xenorhabdus nematophila AN6/1]